LIPHRIALTGFLSYQDEQEVVFDGSQLWMLSGRNGSGKSAIFDGFTFALFGHHRAGSQQTQELINKESNGFSVEFDFSIDERKYRIRRTVKRSSKGGSSSTQQIYQSEAAQGSGEQHWVPIPDTSRRTEFDRWIDEKIGLNYETFTSSVLLLQGQAEKLLDAAPKGRAEVLASIVDLERYQRLHERAIEKRKDAERELDQVKGQLGNIPEVSDEQILKAQERHAEAEQQRAAARAEVERYQQLGFEAKRWEELQSRLARLREQVSQANSLMGEATKIEASYQRLSELREVLPHINAIQQFRAEIEASETRTKKSLYERQQIQNKRDERASALELAHKKRSSLQSQQTQDEQRRQQIEARLRELTAIIERLRLVEQEQARLTELENELQRLPANARQTVTQIQGVLERGQEKAAALPLLERFEANRSELRQARERQVEIKKREKVLRKEGEEAKQRLEKAKADLETASKARAAADTRATEARTLLQQARNELKELEKLKGKKTCSHCGQKLTESHLKEEKARREAQQKEAKKAEAETAQAQKEAQTRETQCQEEVRQAETSLQKLRDKYRDVNHELEQAERDIERAGGECLKAYQALPTMFRERIANAPPDDWLDTQFPEPADLTSLQRDAADVESLRANLRQAEETLRQWEKVHGQAEAARASIARLRQELPAADPAAIRGEHASIQAEEAALKGRLAGSKKSLAENQNDVDRLLKEIAEIEKHLAQADSDLRAEEVHRTNAEDSIDRARRQLPERWQTLAKQTGLSEQHQWNVELRELEEAKTAQRWQQLAQARLGLEGLTHEIAEAEAQQAEFPEQARTPITEIELQLQQARQTEDEKEKLSHSALQEKGILEQHREQRDKLGKKGLELEREENFAKTLSVLLGRDRLQRHLVRVAERQIVDYANAVLDRLSAGQLLLRLSGSEEGTGADRALELEAYNRVTGEAPINVSFLSGSQRFRVAVSLALGIGQYASRQHRPIESVIIDEGFGCLDREGRQVMIQELQNLRGQLRCILLVSHQEEFADAFPDGYRFELEEGATKVTRIQR